MLADRVHHISQLTVSIFSYVFLYKYQLYFQCEFLCLQTSAIRFDCAVFQPIEELLKTHMLLCKHKGSLATSRT